MNLNQIIKIIFAGIFTFLVIGSLSSISNSIFLEKVIDNLSSVSTAKLNKLREEFFDTQSSIDENKKILTHTVVGRKELLATIAKQETILDELSYLSSADAASEHLQKLNNDLRYAEEKLSHSVMGREDLKKKIEETKSEISSFKQIMPSSENISLADAVIEETKPVDEKVVVVEKPKLTFEEELALASVDAGLKLSKKCTACHSLKSGGPNGVGPTLWNIVNAPKASIEGYSYSNGLSSIGGSWTIQDLNMWLKSPKKYAPGNKMSFAGLRKIKDRANMIAFLNSISDEPIPNNGLN
ncbi:MAG: c-type cytochrome [Alphaproteobacteria bacterium]